MNAGGSSNGPGTPHCRVAANSDGGADGRNAQSPAASWLRPRPPSRSKATENRNRERCRDPYGSPLNNGCSRSEYVADALTNLERQLAVEELDRHNVVFRV